MKHSVSFIEGVQIFPIKKFEDERGLLYKFFESGTFERDHELEIAQALFVSNPLKGTFRGLHYQTAPSIEWKYLFCISGSIFDILFDFRSDSKTFGKLQCINLDANEKQILLIPPGVAHGYQTLEDNVSIIYLMSDKFKPDLYRTINYQDPILNLKLPINVTKISEADSKARFARIDINNR